MKTSEIAHICNINQTQFENYLVKKLNITIKVNWDTINLREDDVYEHLESYKKYLEQNDPNHKEKLVAIEEGLKKHQANLKAEEERKEAQAKYEQEREIACANMLITSGFSFDGYRVVKYSGYISGDDAIQIDRGKHDIWGSGGATDVGQALTDSLAKIRRQALKELKEAAYELGCNAVIGVDFDYITLEPETANSSGGTTYLPYVFCVTANGNAVVIEKDDSK